MGIEARRAPIVTALAFVIAPLVPAFTMAALGSTATDLGALPMWTLFLYVWSFGLTIVIALPLYLLLHRFGFVRWWSAALVGFLVGELAVVLFFGRVGIFGYLGYGMLGSLAGLAFWAIWRFGHPAAQPALRGTRKQPHAPELR